MRPSETLSHSHRGFNPVTLPIIEILNRFNGFFPCFTRRFETNMTPVEDHRTEACQCQLTLIRAAGFT